MIGVIDIGNTRTTAGFMEEERVLGRLDSRTDVLRTKAGARRWVRALGRKGAVEGFVISSVVPSVDAAVRESIRRVFQAEPFFVKPGLDLGLRLKVRHPSEVGADRIVNALAARTLIGPPCIVVDFGTATTFDVVDPRGDYRGGAILPGIESSFRALHAFTEKLPDIGFLPTRHAIGRSTVEALRSGVYYGAIGQLRELLLRIRKELRQVAPAIATGGYCQAFKETGIFHRVVPNLTLQGLSIIWRRLHE